MERVVRPAIVGIAISRIGLLLPQGERVAARDFSSGYLFRLDWNLDFYRVRAHVEFSEFLRPIFVQKNFLLVDLQRKGGDDQAAIYLLVFIADKSTRLPRRHARRS